MEFIRFFLCGKIKSSHFLGVLFLLACAINGSGFSLAADELRWYGGIGIGQSRAKFNDAGISNTLLAAGAATATTTAKDERDTSYKLFTGYQFNRHFALEGGYFDLGRFNYTSTTTGPVGSLSNNTKAQGVNIDAVGTLPIAKNFSAIGRVGAHSTKTRDSYAGSGGITVLNPADRWDTNYKLGVGLQYDITKSFAVRGEMERYHINDTASDRRDTDVYSVGIILKFR